MEEERGEIKTTNINNNPRRQQLIEENYRRERQQELAKEKKRKAIQRKRNKKKIKRAIFIAAIATIAIGGLNYAYKKVTRDPLEVASSNVQKHIGKFYDKEGEIITKYEEEADALEQELQYNEQSSNSKLSSVADDAREKIDVQISKLADKMVKDFDGLSSTEVKTSCLKRTDDKENYFYNFSLYHKKSVILNWLNQYFDYSQVENVYDSLSEEEVNALIAFTTYDSIENWKGGSDNKGAFLRIFGFTSDQSDEEKLEDAKKVVSDVSFRVAKESLSQQLGQSLDIEAISVGKGR